MRVDAETMAKEFYEARNPTMRWSALAWWEKMHMAVLAEREACAAIAEKELDNTAMLTSMPPKSSAAWNIRAAIRARGERK